MNHIMLDIETMGTRPTSCIVSIGALEFDISSGETGKEFYTNINLNSCLRNGLTVDADTILWWLNRSESARNSIQSEPIVPLFTAIEMFKSFLQNYNQNCYIWSNAPRFDCAILENAFNVTGYPIPWNFRNERCVRTIANLNPAIIKGINFEGIQHNALDDCKHQIKYLTKVWNTLPDKSKWTNWN